MSDYIKREDAIEALNRHKKTFMQHLADFKAIEAIPTADVVEVVRCKDCKFYEIYPNGANGDCINQIDAFNTFYPDDYCSYGERAET